MPKHNEVSIKATLTPRMERKTNAFYRAIQDYEDRAAQAGEHPDLFAGDLIAFIKLSVWVDSDKAFDFPLLAAGDDADTIYSKFEQFSDTQQYEAVVMTLKRIRENENGHTPEASPVTADADPKSGGGG